MVEFTAPKSQHSIGIIETKNIDLSDCMFRDDAWRSVTPVVKALGYRATHPGGRTQKAREVVAHHISEHQHTVDGNWSFVRAGWALLISNRFLNDTSFHTRDTPSWTQGDVIEEGIHLDNAKKMVVCNI